MRRVPQRRRVSLARPLRNRFHSPQEVVCLVTVRNRNKGQESLARRLNLSKVVHHLDLLRSLRNRALCLVLLLRNLSRQVLSLVVPLLRSLNSRLRSLVVPLLLGLNSRLLYLVGPLLLSLNNQALYLAPLLLGRNNRAHYSALLLRSLSRRTIWALRKRQTPLEDLVQVRAGSDRRNKVGEYLDLAIMQIPNKQRKLPLPTQINPSSKT